MKKQTGPAWRPYAAGTAILGACAALWLVLSHGNPEQVDTRTAVPRGANASGAVDPEAEAALKAMREHRSEKR